MNSFYFVSIFFCGFINILVMVQNATAYDTITPKLAQILTKMYRMELTMETNKNQLKGTQNQILDKINDIMKIILFNSGAQTTEKVVSCLKELEQDSLKNEENESSSIFPQHPSMMSDSTDKKNTNLRPVIEKVLPEENNTNKLLKYLKDISGSKTISGIYVTQNGAARNKGIKSIQGITGQYPGILTTKMPSNSDSAIQWQIFIDEAIANWKDGYLVQFAWWNTQHPLTSMEVFQSTNNENINDRKWRDLIIDGGILNKEWKTQLDLIVPYFKQLEKAGVIPICDFLPFINAKFSFWRGRPGVVGTAKLYKITHDYMTVHHGLNSIIWSWSVYNEGYSSNWQEFWPGNNYANVASVYLYSAYSRSQVQLNAIYPKLLEIVGDNQLISMECLYDVPELSFLAKQQKWTWFSVLDYQLNSIANSKHANVNATFRSDSVINRGFFKP